MNTNDQEFDFMSIDCSIMYLGEHIIDDWKCDSWHVTIGKGTNKFTTEYRTGLGHRKARKGAMMPNPSYRKGTLAYERWEKQNVVPVKPDVKGIMSSLFMDASACDENFKSWCANFGYDDDSIKALNTYKLCLEINDKLLSVFSRDEIEQMQKALEDY